MTVNYHIVINTTPYHVTIYIFKELSMSYPVKSVPELPLLYRPNHESFVQAWWGHRGFAQRLARALRPNTFAELGVHAGDSYFAFVEAFDVFEVECNSYAVDLWEGDEHSGVYDNSIYDSVQNVNSKYSSKSNLLKMTFEQAADIVLNIDLLHIDGLHTYDAVKNDYETWNNKVNDMIIFHDINVPWNPEFGVWKLWDEIKKNSSFQCYEFMHCFGLAVLCKSAKAVNAMESIISTLA